MVNFAFYFISLLRHCEGLIVHTHFYTHTTAVSPTDMAIIRPWQHWKRLSLFIYLFNFVSGGSIVSELAYFDAQVFAGRGTFVALSHLSHDGYN